MTARIEFYYKGDEYAVDTTTSEKLVHVELPNGVVLQATEWYSNNAPSKLAAIDANFQEGREPPKAYEWDHRIPLKPNDFYFAAYHDEYDECHFVFALKSYWDENQAWKDGALEALLMESVPNPKYENGQDGLGLCNNADCDYSPGHPDIVGTPEDIRQAAIAGGFIENPQIILHWEPDVKVLGHPDVTPESIDSDVLKRRATPLGSHPTAPADGSVQRYDPEE